MPLPCSELRNERENASWACFGGRVRARRGEGDGTGDRDDVDDVGAPFVRREAQSREERAGHPDATEVVDACHLFDQVEVDLREGPPGRDAGVVDQQVHGRVTIEDARCEHVDRLPVADVAYLGLSADPVCEGLQPVGAPGDEHATANRALRGAVRWPRRCPTMPP